jgi:hypothetical protein
MLTFFFFFLLPPPRWLSALVRDDWNPFTSSSKIMDGGFTFLPHPCEDFESTCDGAALQSSGGANTTASAETDAPMRTPSAVVTSAPTGTRATAGAALTLPARRTGPKARAADQPFEVHEFDREKRKFNNWFTGTRPPRAKQEERYRLRLWRRLVLVQRRSRSWVLLVGSEQ